MSEHTTEKQRPWLLPDAIHKPLRAGLYIVATPIGNLRDMSFRALDVLSAVDAVLCEDTRVSGKLLHYFGVKTKLEVYNDHSETAKRDHIAARIAGGAKLALVSDAGMPLISDPGYKLVEALRAQNLYVTSVPGANAPLAALQLSGLPSDKFAFLGFLPPKSAARCSLFKIWAEVPASLIAFETGPRLEKTLADLDMLWPERRLAVVREITKLYEEVQAGTPAELIAHYNKSGAPKGEIVLVIHPPEAKDYSPDDLRAALTEALKTMRTKEAAQFVAEHTGAPVKDLYTLALGLKEGGA